MAAQKLVGYASFPKEIIEKLVAADSKMGTTFMMDKQLNIEVGYKEIAARGRKRAAFGSDDKKWRGTATKGADEKITSILWESGADEEYHPATGTGKKAAVTEEPKSAEEEAQLHRAKRNREDEEAEAQELEKKKKADAERAAENKLNEEKRQRELKNKRAVVDAPRSMKDINCPLCVDSWAKAEAPLELLQEVNDLCRSLEFPKARIQSSDESKRRSQKLQAVASHFSKLDDYLSTLEEVADHCRRWASGSIGSKEEVGPAKTELLQWFNQQKSTLAKASAEENHKFLRNWLNQERACVREYSNFCAIGIVSVL